MKNSLDDTTQSDIDIVCVKNDGNNASYFDKRSVDLTGSRDRMLSEQIPALNFRLRTSDTTYSSDWHVAGDPTLLIVLSGSIEIELRNGEKKQFNQGEMFIAQDYLANGVIYDKKTHGHRAQVIGNDALQVLHLKLSKQIQ